MIFRFYSELHSLSMVVIGEGETSARSKGYLEGRWAVDMLIKGLDGGGGGRWPIL